VKLADAAVPMSMTSTGVGATLFAVGVARLAPLAAADDKPQQALATFRDALVRNINGTITRTAPAALNLASGGTRAALASEAIEASGRDGKGRAVRLTARFFVVDDRLYQVVALGGEDEISPEALDTFFTSFRLAAN
jgi:hypothetical protein